MTGLQTDLHEQDVETCSNKTQDHYLGVKYVTRQMRTPVGVLDVLARHPECPVVHYVIEIKKGTIDSAAYVQVLRYAKYLNSERSKDGRRLFVPVLIGSSSATT